MILQEDQLFNIIIGNSPVAWLLQGDKLINIDFFSFSLECFVHNHGGQEQKVLPGHW